MIALVIKSAAYGPVRFRLSRSTSRPKRASDAETPFFIRAACGWAGGSRIPSAATTLGLPLLHFQPRDILEVLDVDPLGDAGPGGKGRWWRARVATSKVRENGHPVDNSNSSSSDSGHSPSAAVGDEGIIPSDVELEAHAVASRQHRAYTRAAHAEEIISEGTQALPISYQRLIKLSADDYKADLGQRPLCVVGPPSCVDLVVQELLSQGTALGFDFVRPIHAVTRPQRSDERDGVDFHFLTADEAERQIELGELFVVDGADPDGSRGGAPPLRGLPIESVLGPAADGKVVVLREADGASMTILSLLAQRTVEPGCQPVIVRLDPQIGSAHNSTGSSQDEGQGGVQDQGTVAPEGSLLSIVEGMDDVRDPGLAEARAQAQRSSLVYDHLVTAIVSCEQPLAGVVGEIAQLLERETTGEFWGMDRFVLPRGSAQKRSERLVTLSAVHPNGEPPFTPTGRHWSDSTGADALLLVGQLDDDSHGTPPADIDDGLRVGDEILEVNGVGLARKTWTDRRDVLFANAATGRPLTLLVRHNPEALAEVRADDEGFARSSRKSSMVSDVETLHEGSETGSPPKRGSVGAVFVANGGNDDGVGGNNGGGGGFTPLTSDAHRRLSRPNRHSRHRISTQPVLTEDLREWQRRVTLQKLDNVFGFVLRTVDDAGPRVAAINPHTPAARSELQIGDHILSINGILTSTGTHADFLMALATYSRITLITCPDEHYRQYLTTKGELRAVAPLTGPGPDPPIATSASDFGAFAPVGADVELEVELVRGPTGYDVALCGPSAADATHRSKHQVYEVQPNGVVDRAGLCIGDAFIAADGRPVSDLSHEEFRDVLMRNPQGHGIKVRVTRSFGLLWRFQEANRATAPFSLGAVTASVQRRQLYVEGEGSPSADAAVRFDQLYAVAGPAESPSYAVAHAAPTASPHGGQPGHRWQGNGANGRANSNPPYSLASSSP